MGTSNRVHFFFISLISFALSFSPPFARGDECNFENYKSILEYIRDFTAPSLPSLEQQNRAAFTGCFEPGEETSNVLDVRKAIDEAEESNAKQKLPIVLVPGYLATDEYDFVFTEMDYWYGIVEALSDAGYKWVFPAKINPVGYSTNGPIEGSQILDSRIGLAPNDYNGRSCQLKEFVLAVLEATGATKVNLIAHSQGALTARWMISNLDMAEHVNSLITLSGPHRGVPLTRLALGEVAFPEWMIDPVENVITRFLGGTCDAGEGTSAHGSHVEMWPPYTEQFFNPNCEDVETVQYFSFGARMYDVAGTHLSPYFLSEFWIIHLLYGWMQVGPNDGLVGRESARGPADDQNWVYMGELVGKKVLPGTGIESDVVGIYWGVDHGAFMNFPLGLTKYYHFDVEQFYVDLARMLNAYSS